MKFDVDDKNRCRLVCVKFHLNRCRFAVAVAKCLGGSLFLGHSVVGLNATTPHRSSAPRAAQEKVKYTLREYLLIAVL